MMDKMTVQQWHEQQFLPWKQALAKYLDEKQQHLVRLHQNLDQLQTIVALLMDGKSRQALLVWNTLQLHPKLSDLSLSDDGQTMRLVDTGGNVSVMKLDDVMEDIQRMLDERNASGME